MLSGFGGNPALIVSVSTGLAMLAMMKVAWGSGACCALVQFIWGSCMYDTRKSLKLCTTVERAYNVVLEAS